MNRGMGAEWEWRIRMLSKVRHLFALLNFSFVRTAMPPESRDSILIWCKVSFKCKYANLSMDIYPDQLSSLHKVS